jgi:hypothetical protein
LIISITIADCRATLEGTPIIICGNKKKYYVKFSFDEEWGADTAKTARFVWVAAGKLHKEDVVFTGDTVKVPPLSGTREVKVGVFEGDLQTTTPARIPCEWSVRCLGGDPAAPTPAQYDQIMELYNQTQERLGALEAGGGGGNSGNSGNSVLLTDRETGTVYELYVSGGKLMMTAMS